jgi:plastocyanin
MVDIRSVWFRTILSVVVGVTLALVPLLGTPVPIAAAQQAPVAVNVVDFAFEPATVTVAVGTTVTWTNRGERPHTVTAQDGSFDSGRLDPGEEFSVTFDETGAFAYFCGFHPDMQGEVVVTAEEAEADAIEVATAAPDQAETGVAPPSDGAGPVRNLDPLPSSRLAHIHAGTCDELGIVVYSFPDIRSYRVEDGERGGVGAVEMVAGTTTVPLDGLFGEPFSVHVHESAQNKQTYLACSDIGGRPAAPWSAADGLVLEAREQQDSGYSGLTTLRPSPDGGTTVSIALAASTSATEAAAAQPDPAPSTTYTSPTFGYAIGYGPTWEEAENVSTNGRDRFVLFNGSSYITFTGERAFGGDPQACVDAFVEQLTADPNVSNLGLAVGEDGEPLEGGTAATGAFAIYNHDYTFPDRTEPYTLFVGCVPLIPNEAVLAIVQNVPTAEYDQQVELREALLRGLTLNQ